MRRASRWRSRWIWTSRPSAVSAGTMPSSSATGCRCARDCPRPMSGAMDAGSWCSPTTTAIDCPPRPSGNTPRAMSMASAGSAMPGATSCRRRRAPPTSPGRNHCRTRPGPSVRLRGGAAGLPRRACGGRAGGQLRALGIGLADMGGNVSEWMHDVYASLPDSGAVTDPPARTPMARMPCAAQTGARQPSRNCGWPGANAPRRRRRHWDFVWRAVRRAAP